MPVRSGGSSFDVGNANALPMLRMRSVEGEMFDAAPLRAVSAALILSEGAARAGRPVSARLSSFDAGNASALPLLRMRSREVEMFDAATSFDRPVALILSKGASWAPASKDEGVAPI